MNRYLTSAKIGLLVLISLYCELDLPGEVSVQILSLIISQLHYSPDLDDEPEQLLCHDLDGFRKVLSKHSSPVPGRNLYDLLVKRLWSIENLHLFHTFFASLEHYTTIPRSREPGDAGLEENLPRIVLSRVSPLGVFVRRARLEFTRVQFDEVVTLWRSFVKFRAPSEQTFRNKNPSTSFDANSSFGLANGLIKHEIPWTQSFDHDIDDVETPFGSQYDIERLLQFQLEKLQRFGTRLSPAFRSLLQDALDKSQRTPTSLSFVRFFDAWRSGDYFSSFDQLHRYFDSTMQAGDRSSYQYALLNMAVLQADFGCFSEALAAMNETIAIARENQDMDCLNFCLGWLNHLDKAHPAEMKAAGYTGVPGVGSRGLDFLKTKAKETGNWSLLSSTLLSEVSFLLSEGGALSQGIEKMYQSSALNLNHGIETMFATQILMSGSIFARVGLNSIALSQLDLVLDCYNQTSSQDEIVRACCSKATLKDHMFSRTRATLTMDPCLTSAQRTLKLHQYITAHSVYLAAQTALRRTKNTTMSSIMHDLLQLPAVDPDLSFWIQLLRVEHQLALSETSKAVDLLEKLIMNLADIKADVSHRVVCLITKAKIWTKIGKSEMGLSILIRASHAAIQANLLPLAWMATGELANVLAELGDFDSAREMLDAVIPQALMTQDATIIARLYFHQASAYAGLAGQAGNRIKLPISKEPPPTTTKTPPNSPPPSSDSSKSSPPKNQTQKSHQFLAKAEHYLECAARYAHRISDIRLEGEVLLKRSMIARVRGDGKLAEDWADKYLALVEGIKQEEKEERM